MNLKPFVKSFVFISICILLLTASSVMAEDAILDQIDRLRRAANQDNYAETIDKFQQIIKDHPATEYAIKAQAEIASVYVKVGNTVAADAAVQNLITNYSNEDRAGNCIWRVAAQYSRSGEQGKAKELCEMALAIWPNHSEYKHTVSKLAEVSIRQAGFDNTEAVTKALIEKYPDDKDMIRDYLRREAAHFSRYGHTSQAQKMSQAILENFSEDEGDIWAHAGVVSSCLILGDTSKAEAVVTKLVSGFQEDTDFAETVNWLAGQYVKASDTTKAIQLYQSVLSQPQVYQSSLSKHPASYFQLIAHKGLARIYMSLGETAKVDEQLDTIERNYREEFGFGEAVFEIAEDYCLRAEGALQENDPNQVDINFSRAIAIWQRNIDQFDDPRRQCHAYYYTANCYQKIGQMDKAVEYYQEVVTKWPDYDKAWDAQFMIGRSYEKLAASGQMDSLTARTQSKTAYLKVIENYATSPAANIARQKLTKMEQE